MGGLPGRALQRAKDPLTGGLARRWLRGGAATVVRPDAPKHHSGGVVGVLAPSRRFHALLSFRVVHVSSEAGAPGVICGHGLARTPGTLTVRFPRRASG